LINPSNTSEFWTIFHLFAVIQTIDNARRHHPDQFGSSWSRSVYLIVFTLFRARAAAAFPGSL